MRDRWSGLNVVVTGGLGFIGSNLAIRLVSRGAHVTVIDLPEPRCAGHLGNLVPAAHAINTIRADLAQPGSWETAIGQSHVVFHLAAQVSHSRSMTDPLEDLSQNCGSLLNVLSAARQSGHPPKIVFTSTRQVYGRATALPLREDHVREPTDINGVHKLAAEEYLRVFGDCFGLRSTIVRLTNTYGPRMDFRSPGRGALNVFIARAVQAQPLVIFGDGRQRRDILHVADVVDALMAVALTDDPGPFHLGQDHPTSLLEFLEILNAIVPIRVEQQPFPADLKSIDIGDSHCDASKLAAAAGWKPRIALADGLRETVDSVRPRPTLSDTIDDAPMIKAFDYLRHFETHEAELLDAMQRVIRSGQLILGPEVRQFEIEFAEFVGARFAVGVASGTDALELALLVSGVTTGDEVITVANSAVPTAAAIREVGAIPRFVDVDPATLNIDPEAADRAVTSRTKAILPVHLHGFPCAMEPLLDLARNRGLQIIEDCAHAHGATRNGRHVGTAGHVSCFSFYPTKNLGAYGDGGICVTDDPATAQRLRALRMYGMGPGRIALTDGRNSRLDELQAAVLRVKLRHLPEQLSARRRIAQRYREGLADAELTLPPSDAACQPAHHQFVIRVAAREKVTKVLDDREIGWGIHYDTPLHHMPAYRGFHTSGESLPHAEAAARRMLSLPIFPELEDHEVDQVIAALLSAVPTRSR